MGADRASGATLTPTLSRSTRARTLHDVVPISCLAEFPNVVQMAKVGATPPGSTHGCPPNTPSHPSHHPSFPQLVCEDINVDRFYPVLYPKVRGAPMGGGAPRGAPHPPRAPSAPRRRPASSSPSTSTCSATTSNLGSSTKNWGRYGLGWVGVRVGGPGWVPTPPPAPHRPPRRSFSAPRRRARHSPNSSTFWASGCSCGTSRGA